MTPLPETAAAHAWRAHMRLSYELERIGLVPRPAVLRGQLLSSSSHWAVLLASDQGERR
ncbi:hypothetical protein [Xanthobacter versatilis]|uniref:hypothetical protein n=1 Tax=Xanthobacter autotrophicus (strain ATCC BAA-1158 / Py2) TaxID=78245 RepID=UPI00372B7B94